MVNELSIQEKELEKKERLVQTYIVIFGLLLASNQNAQPYLVVIFFFFLLVIVPYYTFLTNIKSPVKSEENDAIEVLNTFAFAASFFLGIAIVVFTWSAISNLFLSKIFPFYGLVINAFPFDFGRWLTVLGFYYEINKVILLIPIMICIVIQCCTLTVVISYSLVIIPAELRNNNPVDDIIMIIKMLKN